MPVVKINAIEVPPDAGPELEKRFAHRAHAVDNQPGFLGFQLLRPVKGEDRYFVVTQWESEEAFQAWATGPAVEAHAGQRANPVATGASLLEFEVVLDVAGTGATRNAGRARRSAAGSLTVALVVALACGCANTGPTPVADAAYGVHIDTNTPQGLRAKQTMDMLNSDWPIGTVGVRTMAAPASGQRRSPSAMGNLWWDRPITVTGIDIGAGSATLHVLTSYGVGQDIELRTNDAGLGRPVRGDAAAAGDQDVGRHRRRADASRARATRIRSSKVVRRHGCKCVQSQAPTPTCRCRWRRSSNSMCCLRLPTPSRRAR